jgi:hypothetical protein
MPCHILKKGAELKTKKYKGKYLKKRTEVAKE